MANPPQSAINSFLSGKDQDGKTWTQNLAGTRTVGSLNAQDSKIWAAAVARKYGMSPSDAYRVLNYLDANQSLGEFKNIDDDVSWRDKEISQAIAKMGQDDGLDYLGGESLQSKYEADQAKAKAKQNEDRWAQAQANLQKFADEMNMDVHELVKTDSFAKAASNNAFNQAQDRGRGLGGGLSQRNTLRAQEDALQNYGMQRKQLGLQAMGSVAQQAQSAVGRDDDWQKFNMGMDLQLQQAKDQAAQQAFAERGGVGQAIGSVIGGIGGGLAGIPGGPAGVAAGAAAGSSLGGGIGGGLANGFKAYQPYRYRAPRAFGGGGGLSRGNY